MTRTQIPTVSLALVKTGYEQLDEFIEANGEEYIRKANRLKDALGSERDKIKLEMAALEVELMNIVLVMTNNLQTRTWKRLAIQAAWNLVYRPTTPRRKQKVIDNCGPCVKQAAQQVVSKGREAADLIKRTNTPLAPISARKATGMGALVKGQTMFAVIQTGTQYGIHVVTVKKGGSDTAEVDNQTTGKTMTIDRDQMFSTIDLAKRAASTMEIAKEVTQEVDPDNFESKFESVGDFNKGDKFADEDEEYTILGFPSRYKVVLMSDEGERSLITIAKLKKGYTPIK